MSGTEADGANDLREAVELRVVIARLQRLLRSKSQTMITASQASALVRIEEDGPFRLSSLADTEGIAVPTMSKIVDVLEASGFIERIPDPADGRASLIQLREEGRVLLDEARQRLTRLLRGALDQLSDEERQALRGAVPVLQRVTQLMRSDIDSA
jgi:DNA-binding MarR family transcriptional regulator